MTCAARENAGELIEPKIVRRQIQNRAFFRWDVCLYVKCIISIVHVNFIYYLFILRHFTIDIRRKTRHRVWPTISNLTFGPNFKAHLYQH